MAANKHIYLIIFLALFFATPSTPLFRNIRKRVASLVPEKVSKLIDVPASGIKKAIDTAVPEEIAETILPGEENSTQTCYEKLGCFALGKPWTSILRPLPAPWAPTDILPSVTLFTRESPEGFHQPFNTSSYNIKDSDYRAGRPKTVFVTHGFASNGDSEWLHEMKDAYLKNIDANVFILDWGKGASLINYLQVASNTRIVGAELARFIRYLINEQGQTTKKLHLIGHSLGSHIMSYCAKNISEISKVERITALDPAQPAFEGCPKKVRLDASDAENVDVYHTDAKPFLVFLGFGMLSPVGTVDFYFNGGSMQPGCLAVKTPNITNILDLATYPVEVVSEWVACSHGRAYEYFTAALEQSNCTFWGRKMTNTENFAKIGTLGRLTLADPVVDALSSCTKETCSVAGLETFKLPARGNFAITTKDDYPFCETTEEEKQYLKNIITLGLYDYMPSVGKRLISRFV